MRQNDITLIFGQGGCGKSTLAARLTTRWPAWCTWIHDPSANRELWGHLGGHLCWLEKPPPVSDVFLILDELDLLYPPTGPRAPWVNEAFARGRHHNVRIIGCSQRPARVHPDVRTQATLVYLGHLSSPDDVKTCVKWWGPACNQLIDLPPYRFLKIQR